MNYSTFVSALVCCLLAGVAQCFIYPERGVSEETKLYEKRSIRNENGGDFVAKTILHERSLVTGSRTLNRRDEQRFCRYKLEIPHNAYGRTCHPDSVSDNRWEVCKAFCKPGKIFPNGRNETEAECRNGEWSPPRFPPCVDDPSVDQASIVTCDDLPPKPKNTRVFYCGYYWREGYCESHCDEGKHFPDGSSEARSDCSHGRWSPPLPSACN